MNRRTAGVLALLDLVFCLPAAAELRLARLIGDGMVLQRDVEVAVRGWAESGEEVIFTFDGEAYAATAGESGRWTVRLPPREAGGPFAMVIASREERVEIKDVMVGDVWICSGQSNMEWPVRLAQNAEEEIAAAHDGRIRHFKVPRSASETPAAELADGEWQAASPETVGDFTAVGYYFARELRRHVDVPVALINASWGGSRIEPWMSAEALGLDDPQAALAAVERHFRHEIERRKDGLRRKIGAVPTEDVGMDGETALWADPALDVSGWDEMELPQLWEDAGYPGLDGVGWFRTTLTLTRDEAAAGVELGLGKIDDSDTTWVNGHRIGGLENAWNLPRVYEVPADLLREGDNAIAVRVVDTGWGGGVHGEPELMYWRSGERTRTLAGAWRFRVGASRFDPRVLDIQKPMLLYNGMIHPLLGYPIKGVLWYQGESNAGEDDAYRYRELFAAMIRDWRRRFGGGDFPFLFVQLANFMAPVEEPAESSWAVLRESQSAALAMPATAQAVAIDIGEADDIHPRNKQEVGRRLALAARRLAYGEDVVHSGPTYRAHRVEDGRVVVEFDHVGGGLQARESGGHLKGFAVAGADRRFVWARATIDGNTVVVRHEDVPEPVAVRYAWGDNPDDTNLYNAEGLPASPFRTDDW